MTALELAGRLHKREMRVLDALSEAQKKTQALNPSVNAVTEWEETETLRAAEQAQKRIDEGKPLSPLDGVPIGVKDLICIKDRRTSCASRMLADYVSPYDATAAAHLKAAGLLLPARCNMDEFAMGSTTETSVYGPTRNPWDLTRSPGGSSGGSAAAVAAGMLPAAIGSDTGGSIRQPAAYCAVTGMKPSYGAVSRYGLVAYASSLDQIGPFGGDAADCAALLDILAGPDGRDATCSGLPAPCFPALSGDVRGIRIGLPREYFGEGLDEEVRARILEAADIFRELGADVEECSLEGLDLAIPAYYVLACAEASSNLSRYDGLKYGYRAEDAETPDSLYRRSRTEGFGREVRRRILLGSFVLSAGYYDAYYKKAKAARALIRRGFDAAFRTFDLLLCPVAPSTAPRLGESLQDPLKMYLSDIYTVSVNLAGLPGLSLPCGLDGQDLPVGMQLIGPRFRDELVLRAGDAFQKHTRFHLNKPEVKRA